MSDKRKQTRVNLVDRLPVIDVNTGMLLGDLANISSTGFMVLSRTARPVHSVYQISLSLPRAIDGADTLFFGAECLWCNPTDDQEHYWMGFNLIDISAHDQEVLDLLIASA